MLPARGAAWGQYISKKRPSRFVILSGAKDLCPARDPSLRSEPALERSEGMTLLHRLRLTRKTSYLKCIDPCGTLSGGQVCPLYPRRGVYVMNTTDLAKAALRAWESKDAKRLDSYLSDDFVCRGFLPH